MDCDAVRSDRYQYTTIASIYSISKLYLNVTFNKIATVLLQPKLTGKLIVI
jgi:hypothetical protein